MSSNRACFQYQNSGSCSFGSGCRFLHGDEPTLGSRPAKKAQACYQFKENGSCSFGDKCRFSHDANAVDEPAAAPETKKPEPRPPREPREPRPPREPREPRAKPAAGAGEAKGERLTCFQWKETGECQYGANCRFLHGDEKTRGSQRKETQVCYKFLEGTCDFGDNCRFAHKQIDADGAADGSAPAPAPARKPRRNGGSNVCFSWKESGTCARGDDCRFVHEAIAE